MGKRSNQEIEKYYFEMFRKNYRLPSGTVIYGDSPDVIIDGERKIGIEITNFFLKPGFLSESEQIQIRWREKVVLLLTLHHTGCPAWRRTDLCSGGAPCLPKHRRRQGRPGSRHCRSYCRCGHTGALCLTSGVIPRTDAGQIRRTADLDVPKARPEGRAMDGEHKSATADDWGPVYGELLAFDDPETRLSAIDRLEGFHPGGSCLYSRILAPVWAAGGVFPAWLYVVGEDSTMIRSTLTGRPRWP